MPITLNRVSYTYCADTKYAVPALRDVSLHIADGEFVGIMGRTGCGKSTLIQLIAGLLTPTSGTVLLDGEDINSRRFDRRILRRRIGVVFQYPEYQLFETTVARDVAFGLRRIGKRPDEIENAVRNALQTVGFDYDTVKDLSPLGFSGGEKRRIAIAGVLAAEPGILILDEPVAGLDPLARDAFLELITKLNRSGMTILMISHNTDALAEYAQRILILKDGQLLRDGTARVVFSEYDFLHKNGLSAGEARETAELLRQHGFGIPADTIRYDELLIHLISAGRGLLP